MSSNPTLQGITHHHPDGTVHKHEYGDELHEHASDGQTYFYGEPAPFGGGFVAYQRPGGVVVRVGSKPASAVCPLLRVQAESATVRTMGLVANAYARAGVRDVRLFSALGEAAARVDGKWYSPWAVSHMLHAVAALMIHDEALVGHLLSVAVLYSPLELTTQAVANIGTCLAGASRLMHSLDDPVGSKLCAVTLGEDDGGKQHSALLFNHVKNRSHRTKRKLRHAAFSLIEMMEFMFPDSP